MAGAPVTDKAAARAPRRQDDEPRAPALARIQSQSLLDVVDNVIDKGLASMPRSCSVSPTSTSIYLRVGALLAAADRVFNQPAEAARKSGGAEPIAIERA